MKTKITLVLAFIGMITLNSCTVNEDRVVQNQTPISEVFEVTRSFTAGNNFENLINFPYTIYNSDMVLVYRLSGVVQGEDVWKLLPETFFFTDGTLDFGYEFDFTRFDANIYMIGNDLSSVSNNFRLNQVLRIVIVPANFANKLNTPKEYKEVIKYYNIDESKIKTIQ